MKFVKKLAYGASVAALAAMAPVAAVHAQQTSSELRGSVVDVNGQPVAGAQVTIIHVPTSSTNVATTGGSGAFLQTGLRVGGPYTIIVSAPGFEGEALDGLRLAPGGQAPLRIALAPTAADVITVTGQAISRQDLNAGVGSNFTARDVANQPSLSRDVISTLNRDPLAISGGPNNLSVAGVNPRFNGVTIDGARQQDNFGLGSNTFATARSPINIDIIESVSLVASDYSVTSSGFTGGLVNVTTRGGTNEIEGAAFYYYRDQDWVGSSTFGGEGNFNPGQFEEKEYGISIRGPIVRDRLFFSFSYDRFETASQVDFTASDASNSLSPNFFSTLNQMVQDTYGIDMQGRPQQGAVPEETERWFLRLDWNINDNHRLQVNYQKVEDSGVSNIGSGNFQSAWYDTPTTLENYTVQLFSDWTPELSTELRASYIDFVRGQNCRAGTDTGQLEFRLNAANVVGTPLEGLISHTGNPLTFIGGCDRFRHANEYEDQRLQLFARADYTWNDFIFTVGGEYENLDLYNMFVERSSGAFVFTGAQNILDRVANIQYRNVPSNVARDGAAEWGYSRWVGFGQVRWQALPTLELTGGLRYERISTDDQPTFDPTFEQAVGFDNTTTTDGLDLWMPRVSFRWDALDRTTVTGGIGLFAGGDPGVWTSNAFQVPAVFASGNFSGADVTGNSIPASLLAAVAGGTPLAIDAIDPNFRIPSDWKASVRVEQEFDLVFGGLDLGRNYVATAQVIHSRSRDSFLWREAAQTNQAPFNQTGVAPDGRPIYADLQALGVSNRTILTNDSGDESTTFTRSLANEFENGFGFFAAYANQDVQMITEGSSSRGISSLRGQVASDINFPDPRTSIYQVEHAFKLGLSYERDFIGDLATRFDLFGQINSGSPFTYTFSTSNTNALFGRPGGGENPFPNRPLYIPSQNDGAVVYASGFNLTGFNNFIDSQGITRGAIHEVNSATAPWQQRWDLRVQQDLPGIPGMDRLVGDNRFKLVLDIENVLNLLNNSWGTRVNAPGNGQRPIVAADLVSAADVAANGIDGATALTGDAPRTTCLAASDCVYRYNTFIENAAVTGFRSNPGSVWYARIGLRYEF